MRSRVSLGLLVLSALVSLPLAAAWQGTSEVKVQSVSELTASLIGDDVNVVVEGQLVKEISPELFLFRDASGEIKVEIEPEAWQGVDVKAGTAVRLMGELDSEWGNKRIDVERVEVIPTH